MANTHSFLLLADKYQPSGDWTASMDFTWIGDLGDQTYGNAFADFGLWLSPARKLSIAVGAGGSGVSSAARSTVEVQVRYWDGNQWIQEVRTSSNLPWTPASWNTATLVKRGNVYRLLINDVEVLEYLDLHLDGEGRLGLHSYGTCLLDSFLLEQP